MENAIVSVENILTDCKISYSTLEIKWSGIEKASHYEYCVGTNESQCDISDGWQSTTSLEEEIHYPRQQDAYQVFVYLKAINCLEESDIIEAEDIPLNILPS